MYACFHSARFYITFRLIFSIALLAGFSSGAFHAFAFAGEVDSLRWHFEGQRRVADGGVDGYFSLHGADDLKIDELEFFYTTTASPRRRNPDAQRENVKTVYHKKVPADTRNLIIYCGRYVQLELWAAAKAGGVTYVAQTALNLYGESGIDETDFEKIDELPAFTGFDIRRQGFYAAMTGERINFSIKNGRAVPIRVFLDSEWITELLPEDGVYYYVLPSGRKLTAQPLMGHHELLFVADQFDADDADGIVRFTCYLPLYRSARDNLDIRGGLGTLFSAALISLIAVVLKGRNFAWR